MNGGDRRAGEGQELEEGGWKQQLPLTLDHTVLVPPRATYPLVAGDKGEVLVQGQESHCSAL